MNANILSSKLEDLVDNPKEVSLREFLTKIYVRPLLFWSCVIVPTILALVLTSLVPTSWTASVKIMLRYGSAESPFLQGLIPESRPSLSGAASAEILRGIPTLVNTITENDIRDEDIYKKPHEVLGGHLSGLLEGFFPSELPPGLPGVDPKTLLLAKAFKDSLQEKSSSGSGKKKPVEVLEKSSQLPPSMKGDELITVVVESFNRQKVAQMANGLAKSFIDEYYRVSAAEARSSYLLLNDLVTKAAEDVERVKRGLPPADMLKLPDLSAGGTSHVSPLVTSMSSELTSLEGRLSEAEGVYAENADQVQRLRTQIARVRAELTKQERIDKAREVLEQLKLRRYQAENTEKLYVYRLIPISVVEPAFTPKKSFSKVATRYVIAGGVGLVLGLVLGLGLVVILDVIDPRLHTSWQTRARLRLPILATLPDLGRKAAADPLASASAPSLGMVNGLLQIFARLRAHGEGQDVGKVIVITSAGKGEGKTFVSLALAGALGQGGRHRVLIIDANLQDAQLSALFGKDGNAGYVDCILDESDFAARILPGLYRGCDVLPAGKLAGVSHLGFYEEVLRAQLAKLRTSYEFVIVDTGALLASNEALICGMSADDVLLVTCAGQTRKPLVAAALQKLREVGIAPDGVIFNRKRDVLPSILYRNV